MKNLKKIKIALLFAGLSVGIVGCKEQQDQPPEIAEEGEQEMKDTKESVDLLMNALLCREKEAESVLRSLERQKIGNLTDAKALDASEGYKVQITDESGNTYILHIDKKYHLYAIQENDTEGEYIYREIE